MDHVGAQRQRCALELTRGLGTQICLFDCFPTRNKIMEKSSNVDIVTPKHYGVISQHYGVISQHYGAISRHHNSICLHTIFTVHGLVESMEKRSFVLFRVLGSPLCQSRVQMVSHSSKAPTNTFLWQRHFCMSCIKISGLRQKKNAVWDSSTFLIFFVRSTYLGMTI